jgi:hypothetical protein
MAKPSRALLQARSDLLDKEVERHDLKEKCLELERQLAETGEAARAAGNRFSVAIKERDDARADRDQARTETFQTEKQRQGVIDENNALRELLHQAEIEVARMRGVLDRVREFDPVTDRQLFEEGGRAARFDGMMDAAERRQQRLSWYRRG